MIYRYERVLISPSLHLVSELHDAFGAIVDKTNGCNGLDSVRATVQRLDFFATFQRMTDFRP